MFHLIRSKCSPVSTTGQQNDTRGKYCSPVSTPPQQNGIGGYKTPPPPPNKITPEAQIVGVAKRHLNKMAPGALKQGVNKMTLEENIVHLLMSLVFMSLYLVLN